MKITSSGTINETAVRELSYIACYGNKHPKKRVLLYILSCCLLFGLLILKGVLWGFNKFVFVMLAVCIIVIFLQIYLYWLLPFMRINTMKKLFGRTNYFEFYETGFSITTTATEVVGNTTVEYSLIKIVFETNKHLFLFLQNGTVYIVEKQTLQGNTDNLLQNKLMEIAPKYKRCNY